MYNKTEKKIIKKVKKLDLQNQPQYVWTEGTITDLFCSCFKKTLAFNTIKNRWFCFCDKKWERDYGKQYLNGCLKTLIEAILYNTDKNGTYEYKTFVMSLTGERARKRIIKNAKPKLIKKIK